MTAVNGKEDIGNPLLRSMEFQTNRWKGFIYSSYED